MKNSGVLFVLIACFLWALDTLIRYPLVFGGIDIVTIVFWEHIILATIFAYKFVPLFKKLDKKTSGLFLLVGCGGSAAATLMFTKAFSLSHPTLVVLIQKTQPIFALLLAHFWLKEKLTKRFIFLSILAMFGALVLISEDIFEFIETQNISTSNDAFWGYGFALLAAALWGSSTVVGRRLTEKKFTATQMTAGRVYFALIFFIPFIIKDYQVFEVSSEHFLKILLMSVISGFLGLIIYYKGLSLIKAKVSTITEMSFPIWVILLNWIVLGQSLSLVQIIGALILMISIYFLKKTREKTA